MIILLLVLIPAIPHAPRASANPDSARIALLDSAKWLDVNQNHRDLIRLLDPIVRNCDSCQQERVLLARALIARRGDHLRALRLIEYLGNAPPITFLRAEALRGLYRFDEAREFYLQYLAHPAAERNLAAIAHRRLAECQNANQLLASAHQPILQRSQRIHQDSLRGFGKEPRLGFTWIDTPTALQSEIDRANPKSALMRYPERIKPGDRLFFTSRNAPGESIDIHFVTKLDADLWAKPEPAGFLINSPQDEAMPVLSHDGATLYFSSKGHYGMGDFDIFRAQWDHSANRWLPAENLGFPFNSPHDDFLLAPPDQSGNLILASNRDTPPDSIIIYHLRVNSSEPGAPVKSMERVAEHARFRYAKLDQIIHPDLAALREPDPKNPQPNRKPATRRRSVDSDPEYQAHLDSGHRHQQRADSLRDQLTRLREALWEVSTTQQRKQIEDRIDPIERSLIATQKRADAHFASASIIEQEYIAGKRALTSTKQGKNPFADDLPLHLHGAKMAYTAFQSGEIAQLAKAFKHLEPFIPEAKAIITLRQNLGADPDRQRSIESLTGGFTRRYQSTIHDICRIYDECLAVALMKSQRNEGALVKQAERNAKEHAQLARTIRNNADSSTQWRSAFEALIQEAIAIHLYEQAYAHAWGMDAYRERGLKRIQSLKNLAASAIDGSQHAQEPDPPSTTTQPQTPIQPDTARLGNGHDPIAPDRLVDTHTPDTRPEAGIRIDPNSPYTNGVPIPRDEPFRPGVVYRLQLGAYSNPIDPEIFRGMVPIAAETLNGGRITKYYAGDFHTKTQADAGKPIAAQCGFPDAFIVAWVDGRSVPVARAQSLEGNLKKSPPQGSTTTKGAKQNPAQQKKQNPDAFRVLVGVFEADLPEYVRETLSILAPNRQIAKLPAQNGMWSYFVDQFQDKIQAERLRDNLLASGYTDARIETISR